MVGKRTVHESKTKLITTEVLRHFGPDLEAHLPTALQSYVAYQEANHRYHNWQAFYTDCYGIPEDRLDEAGRLWRPEEQKNKTIPDMYSGLVEVLGELKGIPMGIIGYEQPMEMFFIKGIKTTKKFMNRGKENEYF